MDRIIGYIADELLSPENAAGQYDRIADAILTLDTFPERHRIMESSNEKTNGLRIMPVDNFCVFYCIRDKRVFVTDVLYGACDYESKLRRLD